MTNTIIKIKLIHFLKNTFTKTPAQAVNIAGGSTALTKLKYLFSVSLLTLSLNVVSDTQQFNKAAYLDFSKPYTYNWNNTQAVNKKDNQATTLLKEVAGTVRNALGGIDSNNANQFGKTLSTNVANQLKNKAISTTEGFINDKANEYANSIGSGRSEISIYGIDSQALDYSIKTIQPLTTLDKDSKNLTFFQGRLNSGENHGERRNTLNLGIGQRFLLENDKSIVGINLFTDYETKSKHKRLSLGLEYQRTNFKANINKYYPLTDKKVIGTFTEEVLPGYDVKLEGQAPYLPWAKIKGSRYYWDGQQGPDIKGTILGVEVKLTPSLELEIGTEKSNTAERASYARLTTQLPFKDNERFTDFSISDTPFKNEGIVHLTDLSPVERSNKIRIEKLLNGVSNGVSVVLGEYNATTVGARCVVYSASNVAIAGGSGVTDARGLVDLSSVVIPAGLVTMTCTGGSYTDEATGSTIPAPMFRAATIYSGTGELTLITSPLSEIAYRLATAAGNLAANIADQNTVVATAFGLSGINITNIIPTDLNNEVAGDSPKGKFGLVLAGISQMQESSPAVTIATLATDISDDGTLNDANQDLATAINRCATGGMGLGDGTACATGSGRTGSGATATGEGTIKGNLAIVKISNYDGTNVVPTLQDYIDAGVTGVTAGNLAAVNADIATATTTDSDTNAEIQVIVNTTVTAAAASSSVLADIGTDANTASTSDTTIAEFGAILPALTGFVDANLADYQAYIDANSGSFASPATQAEVQAMVTAVNVTVAAAAVASNSVLADIGTDANTASTSDTTIAEFGAILPALTGFVDANLADYQAYIDANSGSFASPATQAEVQAMVTAVNATVAAAAASNSVLADIGTDANTASTSDTTIAEFGAILPALTGFVDANLADYQAYIDANSGSFASPATQAEVQAMVTAVNATVAAAATSSSVLADIGTDANTASTSDTTIAEFGAILPALTGFVDANLADYQAYIDANSGSFASPATQAEVQAMVTAVNATVAAAAAATSSSVLADIGTDANTASTSDTTIAEFGAILPALTGFVDANLADYQAYIDANSGSFASPATQAEVQAMVTAVNATVAAAATSSSVLADIGTDANTASTSDTTIAEFGVILPALTGFVDANLADYQAYIDANSGSFASPATQAEVQAMVTTVNATVAAAAASNSVLADIGTDANTARTSDTTIAEFGAILPALMSFVDANLTDYQTYIDANSGSFASPATQAEVQAMVTAVNATVAAAAASNSVLADIGTDANTASTSDTTIAEFGAILPALMSFVDANLTDYQTYIDANSGSFASPATQAEVQAMVTAVNATVAAAAASNSVLADIGTDANTASTSDTTIAEFGAILPALMSFVDANLTDYQTYIDANSGSFASPATQAEVQAMVTAVNATVAAAAASNSVLADIGTDANTASTSDTTIAEFGAILPALTDFVDANLAAYQAYINDNPGSFSSPATQAEVQAMVTAVNASNSVLEDIGTDANTASTSDTTIAEFGAILPALMSFVDANLTAYQAYINDNPGSFSSPATQAEVQAMITAVNPSVVAGTVIFKNLTYKIVKSPDTNKMWLDRNLGATKVCASSTDSACYGNLYQWGRNDDGHESRTSGITATLATTITPAINKFITTSTSSTSSGDWSTADSTGSSRISAWTDGGANDICPTGFSVPTEEELTADTTSATTTDVINSATALSSFLKIPVAGYRDRMSGTLYSVGSDAYLWSRSANGSRGRFLGFSSGGADFYSDNRALGSSVRCIKD